jgi:lipopolysaccharide/colanic/teichoic acid biosynthesis glycosyltransferase
MNDKNAGVYARSLKRVLDLAFCVLALLVLLPLLVIIALVLRVHLGSPVFFTQERLGFEGRSFSIRKFRTMTDARGGDGELLPDAERLTPIGRFLRATSLDELPELFNVLRGEMSVVGPRPLYSYYRERYTADQFRRHKVLPGITGWAQVNGRNELAWEEKFALDVWYVDHQSFSLDVKIIALTIDNLVRRKGINQPGHATAQEFKGTLRKEA